MDSVNKEAYYTILGVKPNRSREVLSIVNNVTEGASFWQDIFEALKKRGVQEIGLVVSDALVGIETVIGRNYPAAQVQLCCVHLQRECQKYAKPAHRSEMAEDLRDVLLTDDRNDSPAKGIQRWKLFCQKWGKYYPSFLRKADNERYELYFTYLGYHHRVRNMIYSTNWIERLNRDYKRTTKMRGALPNANAVLLLLGSVAMNRKAYERKVPNLIYEKVKFRWEED